MPVHPPMFYNTCGNAVSREFPAGDFLSAWDHCIVGYFISVNSDLCVISSLVCHSARIYVGFAI